MRDALRLPRRARILLCAAVAAGAGILAWRATELPTWSGHDVLAWALVTAGVTVAGLFPISFRYQEELSRTS